MQHVVALDISSPLHTLQNYNTASLESIAILILKVTIQNESFRLSDRPLMPSLTTEMLSPASVHKYTT